MNVRVDICGVDTASLPKLSHNETMALLAKVHSGDEIARNEFIMSNVRLVLSVIKRFWNKKECVDDVFQVGCVGLIKAMDNFDMTMNVRFSTYAVPMIMGEVRRYLRDNNSLKVTRSLRDIAYKALQEKERIENELNRDATCDEIAKNLDIPTFDVVCALEAISEPMSLYDPVYNQTGEAILLLDQIRDEKNSVELWTENVALAEATTKLNDKEKQILLLRYYVGKTQVEVSKQIGISQAQVSRIEKYALKHMKENL